MSFQSDLFDCFSVVRNQNKIQFCVLQHDYTNNNKKYLIRMDFMIKSYTFSALSLT